MKNMQLFSCLLFTAVTAIHCMEDKPNNQQAAPENPWKAIDCKAVECILIDDYHSYLKNRLAEYKQTDFTPQDMGQLLSKGVFITGNQFIRFPYNDIRNEDGDTFFTVAVKKQDLPIVNWHVSGSSMYRTTREDFDMRLAICIKHLHPEKTDESERKTAYEIIKTLCTKQGHNASIFTLRDKSCRENLIKQLIALQIKHKRHSSDFVIENELITQHLTSGEKDQSPIVLADMYQTVAKNKKRNTLSHIIVTSQNPDELWELITKEYVSPLKNKDEKTVLDLAHAYFQSFSRDATSFDVYPDESQRARCCLFMLLNYIKSKQNNQELATFTPCCDKHTVKK